jgi:hypothetical protein
VVSAHLTAGIFDYISPAVTALPPAKPFQLAGGNTTAGIFKSNSPAIISAAIRLFLVVLLQNLIK